MVWVRRIVGFNVGVWLLCGIYLLFYVGWLTVLFWVLRDGLCCIGLFVWFGCFGLSECGKTLWFYSRFLGGGLRYGWFWKAGNFI